MEARHVDLVGRLVVAHTFPARMSQAAAGVLAVLDIPDQQRLHPVRTADIARGRGRSEWAGGPLDRSELLSERSTVGGGESCSDVADVDQAAVVVVGAAEQRPDPAVGSAGAVYW